MTAKGQAIKDIKDELRQSGKVFIAFRKELNPVMDSLVDTQIKAQRHVSCCMSAWAKSIEMND